MRLAILDHGHRTRARMFLGLVRRSTGHPIDPVAQLALYRPGFFGKPFLALAGQVLRGPSFWTPAEREYLAAFTSGLNQCQPVACTRQSGPAHVIVHGTAQVLAEPHSVHPFDVARVLSSGMSCSAGEPCTVEVVGLCRVKVRTTPVSGAFADGTGHGKLTTMNMRGIPSLRYERIVFTFRLSGG